MGCLNEIVLSEVLCRHIVGLAGTPGAGKSTLAHEVINRVNKLWPGKLCSFESKLEPQQVAIVLPMDGFHLYRHQLDAMEVVLYLMTSSFSVHFVGSWCIANITSNFVRMANNDDSFLSFCKCA